ncbi:hypothetical protein NIES37_67230 [Tolypothrix tenuis PCC 7101]|uniref:Uncharacterized protein n=1 Tax=Tolypothrix tenuis PCC 7101 TaxID=231146 RepID=A0A1Z4NAH4_9CYAN|nr:hypothetical protein NIES37_67230 [Tolypothrix tenuis PCC 7101]BAZ78397.1 hypothetical protein NIES50_70300 [Aulosira laxa NIES-50]
MAIITTIANRVANKVKEVRLNLNHLRLENCLSTIDFLGLIRQGCNIVL